MEKKDLPPPPAFTFSLLTKRIGVELEILAYIERADDGIVLLEEIEDKYFVDESHKKYFNILRNLHKKTVDSSNKDLLFIKDSLKLVTPNLSKDLYIKKIKDLWFTNEFYRFIELAHKVIEASPLSSIHDTARSLIDNTFKLIEHNAESKVSTFGDLTFKEIYEERAIESFGYKVLDGLLIRQGSINVIGVRPGHGKTTLALNLMLKSKKCCAFFSYEMPVKIIQDKLVRSKLECNSNEINQKKLEICEALHSLSEEKRIYIIDASSLTIDKLMAKIRFLHRKFDIHIFYIDYLGLIPAHKRFEKRYLEIGYFMRALKLLALDLNICIFCLAQLSREADKSNSEALPSMSDLKESGSIEETADLVMLINSPSSVDPETSKPYEFVIKIAKNRYGPLGIKKLYYNKRTGSIKDW